MADSTHTLEVVTGVRDEASRKLTKVGATGKKAGVDTAKGQKVAQKEISKTTKGLEQQKRSLLELGEGGKRFAAVAGSAMASVGAGVALATADMDNLAGSAATAAGSIAAGFAAGGPVGGAIAAASAAVGGLIFALRQSEVAAEEAAKRITLDFKAAQAQIQKTSGALRGFGDSFEDSLGRAQLEATVSRLKAAGVEFDEQKFRIERNANILRDQLTRRIREGNEELRKAGDLYQAMVAGGRATHEEMVAASNQLRALGAELKDAEATLGRVGKLEAAQLAKVLNERVRVRREQRESEKAAEDARKSAIKTQKVLVTGAKDVATGYRDAAAQAKAFGAAITAASAQVEREQQARRSYVDSLREEVALARARAEGREEEFRAERQIRQAREKGGEEAVRLVKKRLELEEMIAQAGEAQLKVQKATTVEVAKRARIRFQDPSKDVTQEFKGVAGTGFGFGRSQGFGQFYQPARQQRTRSPAAGAAGAAGAAADQGEGQVVRELQGVSAGLPRLGTQYGRLSAAVQEHRIAMDTLVRQATDMTADTVTALAEGQANLRADVSSLRADLEAAQQLGLAGE